MSLYTPTQRTFQALRDAGLSPYEAEKAVRAPLNIGKEALAGFRPYDFWVAGVIWNDVIGSGPGWIKRGLAIARKLWQPV